MTHKILMGSDNPEGWKLEELLCELQDELIQKTKKISDDRRLAARLVASNNYQICGLLAQAVAIQQSSMAVLADVAPNEGPLGTPRIGPGSKSETTH
ncbi:MAG: hypothetical protein NXH95_13530 [Pseudomonadaceae bacterium]|nr:hypothetical protein [Pseudomonadaceae bacterium]